MAIGTERKIIKGCEEMICENLRDQRGTKRFYNFMEIIID